MKINNNISAVITNKQLLGTEGNLAASMERLSSGLKINHAVDAPSGIAISNKMKAQIKGLDQASRNSSDGTSVLQTVDGALGEVTNMLQRMRELAVQAANGTNSITERQSCQKEIASLRDEIDRVSQTTEFNTKSLLDGSLDARVYLDKGNVDDVSRIQVSDTVAEGEYQFTVNAGGTKAEKSIGAIDNLVGKEGNINVNGVSCDITKDMSKDDIFIALRDMAELADCDLVDNGAAGCKLVSKRYGSHAEIVASQYGDDTIFPGDIPNLKLDPDEKVIPEVGKDATVTLDKSTSFGENATVVSDGNKITITDSNGFKMSMLLAEKTDAEWKANPDVKLEVTDIGIMDVQVGANEGQTIQLRIPATDVKSLYLDDINVVSSGGALRAMDSLSDAIERISEIRSQIGAYENRLDYTVNSLDLTEENMTSALSRIEDVDMAEEMVEYTKNNVLQQAGTSALAQANSLPELALQMLKN